ncbi:MAG: hypothetical protein ACM3ST_01130 [Bdellovibrio bacteriovorus]
MALGGFDRALWLVILGLLAAIAGVAVYKVQPLLNPKPVLSAPLDPGCDLRLGPCRARFPGGGELTFEIRPSTLPVLVPLTLKVAVDGLEASAAEVDFAGVDMNMGFNRVALRPVGGGRFEGEGMLPTCVRDRMSWEAKVLVQSRAGLAAAPFRFETRRNP